MKQTNSHSIFQLPRGTVENPEANTCRVVMRFLSLSHESVGYTCLFLGRLYLDKCTTENNRRKLHAGPREFSQNRVNIVTDYVIIIIQTIAAYQSKAGILSVHGLVDKKSHWKRLPLLHMSVPVQVPYNIVPAWSVYLLLVTLFSVVLTLETSVK